MIPTWEVLIATPLQLEGFPSIPFGTILRYLRETAGYTQSGLAEKIEEQQSNYCNIEKGARQPWKSIAKHRLVIKTLRIKHGSFEWWLYWTSAGKYQCLPPDLQGLLQIPELYRLLYLIFQDKEPRKEIKRLLRNQTAGKRRLNKAGMVIKRKPDPYLEAVAEVERLLREAEDVG